MGKRQSNENLKADSTQPRNYFIGQELKAGALFSCNV